MEQPTLDELFDEVEKKWRGMNQRHALKALAMIGSGEDGEVVLDSKGRMTGVIAYEVKKDSVIIKELAARKQGGGAGGERRG